MPRLSKPKIKPRNYRGKASYLSALKSRFKRLTSILESEGQTVGTGHKRIMFDKETLSRENIDDLGFVPVTIAIPEAGQTSFRSFRHPNNNFHIHEHGTHWTMHEDDHPAGTMLVKKWSMERNKRKQNNVRVKAPSKKSLVEDIKEFTTPVKHIIKGIPHVATEGVPGAYYYVNGR